MGDLPDSIRMVNLAGEALRSELVKQIYESTNVEKVYDLYGPSEATTYSTFTLRDAEGPPTIGRPISNTRIYILDENLQPVPIGVPGELYIGGAGVARGYLNRSELTCEKFILNSSSDEMKPRLYQTGDLARYRSDGNIEFVGRVDNQVKIRGYRIELGEIEAVLNQHPAVKDSVVAVRGDVTEEESGADNPKFQIEKLKSSPSRLVAYVVPTAHQPSIDRLRDFLKEKLPHYMIPSAFVMLEALPLMPNGKVNRSKLPPPDVARSQLTQELIAPRSEIEELVVQVWKDILKVENIGVHDSFFELGGHSLLATQIIARLSDAFNREIPLKNLFDAPTIAGLAETLENIIGEGNVPNLPPIVPVRREGALPLSVNQEHLWRLDHLIPGTHFFNMPYVYQLTGDLNVDALHKALKEIVRRHEALRTIFAAVDGAPVQIIKDGSDCQLPVRDLRAEAQHNLAKKTAAVILEERERPFNLAVGPLFRAQLLRLKDTEHFLLITLHHIISDHWSMRVLRTELRILYSAFSQKNPSPLPDPRTQFADFACWERRLLAAGLLENQLEFWKEQFASPLSELRHKKGSGERLISYDSSHQTVKIDAALFAEVKKVAASGNLTTFMVVVAALNLLLYLYSKERDIRIATLVANRRRNETDGAIGHFLNTVILRTHVARGLTFKKLLSQTREVILNAYAHQEFPFEQLACVIEADRSISRASLFNALVIYNTSSLSVDLPGLAFAHLDMSDVRSYQDVGFTRLDLIFSFRESSTSLTGTVNYKKEAYNDAVVTSMMKLFCSVVKRIALDTEPLMSTELDSFVV